MQATDILDEPARSGQTLPSPIFPVYRETEWLQQKCWRRLTGDEPELGHQARRTLAILGLYPSGPLELDSAFAVLEENHRAVLGEIIAELSRTDLAALYELVRLLALSTRDDEVFEYVKQLDKMIIGAVSVGSA